MDAAGPSPSPRPLHVVICPWLAFGHLLPYLELAERLASRGHRASFVSTPRNLARLPPPRHAGVHLVPLPFPRVEGLPDGAESTHDVPADKFGLLWEAFDSLVAPFTELLRAVCADEGGGSHEPDWVIADTFSHWASAAALQHGVPCAMLQPSAAIIAAVAGGASERAELAAASVFEQMAAAQEPPADMPRYEWEGNAALFTAIGASGMSVAQRCTLALERCTIAAIWSCPEWEPDVFPLAEALLAS